MRRSRIHRWLSDSRKNKERKADLKAAPNDEAIPRSSIKHPAVTEEEDHPSTDGTEKSPMSLTNPLEEGPLMNEIDVSVTLPPSTTDARECESNEWASAPNREEQYEDPEIDMSLPQLTKWRNDVEQRLLELYESQKRLHSEADHVDKLITSKLASESKQNLDCTEDTVADTITYSDTVRNEVREADLELPPQDLPSTFQPTSTTVRVSLEQYGPRIAARNNTIDASNTIVEEFSGSHELMQVRVFTPTSSKRSDEVSDDPEKDDDTILSTQTMDPRNNASAALTENVHHPSKADAAVIPTPPHRNHASLAKVSRSFTDPNKKRKPFRVSSADHDNRKKTRPICDTATDPRKEKRIPTGWVTNQPARIFLRQMEHPPQHPVEETKSTAKPVHPKMEKTPTKWKSKSAEDRLEQEPSYAYKEVVRKQCERKALNCYDCPNCQNFYAALRKAGHEEDIAILSRRGGSTRQTSDVNRLADDDVRDGDVSFGRHRARFAQTETPVDFWELDFIDERDATTTPPIV